MEFRGRGVGVYDGKRLESSTTVARDFPCECFSSFCINYYIYRSCFQKICTLCSRLNFYATCNFKNSKLLKTYLENCVGSVTLCPKTAGRVRGGKSF